MQLLLSRDWKKETYTIGRLYLNDQYFSNTLEPPVRILGKDGRGKIGGMTAIPEGRYKVTLDVVSPKYKNRPQYRFCGGRVPRLQNVPFFDGILIHIGNTVADTKGCILTGENKQKGRVLNSTATFRKLWYILEEARLRGEQIEIIVRN